MRSLVTAYVVCAAGKSDCGGCCAQGAQQQKKSGDTHVVSPLFGAGDAKADTYNMCLMPRVTHR